MKAAYITEYGQANVLKLGELSKPKITSSQVLIKVVAAGVNPVDFLIRDGMLKDSGTHSLPLILGWDAAGIVCQVGNGVTDLNVGDEVFTYAPLSEQGSYAEYLAVDANMVAHKPRTFNFVESAAVPLAATTAWQALFEHGNLKSGQRVLIHNASGGVGSFAVQIAKHFGAYVIGTASAAKEQYVKELGADEFIDYQNKNFEDELDKVDLVFAAVSGNDVVPRSLGIVKSGGHLVSVIDEISESEAAKHQVNYIRMWVQPNKSYLLELAQLIEKGSIKLHLDSVYPLEHVQQAHLRSESRRATGKIVLNIVPEIIGRTR